MKKFDCDDKIDRSHGGTWEDLRARLRAAQAAVETGFEPDSEQEKTILKERARRLAQEITEPEKARDFLGVVGFYLAQERYAIELTYVAEVYPLKDLAPLPQTPPFVLGIFNARGRIISVLDIKKLIGLPDVGLTDLNRVIVLHCDDMEFGVLADSILGVKLIPVDTLQPLLPTLTGVKADYFRGVTGDRVVVLDGKKILTDPKIIIHEKI
ncbi:MAG: purine-binding chemotaxis protein CheW [Deltaproteobacteria bacterium]|nr:purine-binding chemotaxis protein CheW [Deltaproteobacteria bacterium]